ncbi:MAG: hypothetical protein IMF11_13180, partial [Proteobacteria bacterium]|nr:hypothetical protein [Pseudomonadota bacterium]
MKKLVYSLFAIILGIGLLAANVSATSYDPTGPAGSLPIPPTAPLILNHGMVGDALFGEIYRAVVDDTIGGVGPVSFVTYVSIENTSDKWVAAHVRLRSGRFSIEVVDFPILLSPHDVFWFQFESVASGTPGEPSAVKLWSKDKDTILKSGLDTFYTSTYVDGLWTLTLQSTILDQFTNLSADYKLTKELTQGYIEVFGLFALDFPATYSVQEGHNFYTIMSQLWADSNPTIDIVNPGPSYLYGADPSFRVEAIDVQKALTGHVFMGDFTNGLYTGYTMKAIKDFRTSAVQDTVDEIATGIDRRDFFIRDVFNASGTILVHPSTIIYNYGNDAAYTEPDWTTSFGPTWNDGTNTVGIPVSPVDSFSLDEVDDATVKAQLKSTYFNGGFSGETFSVAVVTAFTKYLHFFYNRDSGLPTSGAGSFLTGVDPGNQWPVGNGSQANSARNQMAIEEYIGNLGIEGAVWNQAQESPRGASPFETTTLPWEVTMIPIGQATVAALSDFCFLTCSET